MKGARFSLHLPLNSYPLKQSDTLSYSNLEVLEPGLGDIGHGTQENIPLVESSIINIVIASPHIYLGPESNSLK